MKRGDWPYNLWPAFEGTETTSDRKPSFGPGGDNPPSQPTPGPLPPTPARNEAVYRGRGAPSPSRPGKPLSAEVANARLRTDSRRRLMRTLLVVLVVGFVSVAGLVVYIGNRTGDFIHNVFPTPIPVRPPTGPVDPNTTPEPEVHKFPDWSKKEPVNILLIGIDERAQDEDTRADTQIIVHIDPIAKTASMISIPRDLWVNIPGYGEDRINGAFQKGEHDNTANPGSVPGGGAGLAESTMEADFGVPIDYYARVNFKGFEDVVDSLGGVTIDVARPLVDNDYPLALTTEGSTRIYIPAGLQHMDGKTALEYARSRHADSDIGRNSRQQQVLLALRQQGLNLNILAHLNDLADQLSHSLKTDLSVTQLGSLAQLSREIKPGDITTCQIDASMVQETTLPSGADVLLPRWEIIKPKVAQCFANPQLAREAARLSVKNGTTTGGIGRKVQDLLAAKGLYVADLAAAANQGSYPKTVVTDYTGGQKPDSLAAIVDALGLTPADVVPGNLADAPLAVSDGKPIDIMIVAGDDRLTQK